MPERSTHWCARRVVAGWVLRLPALLCLLVPSLLVICLPGCSMPPSENDFRSHESGGASSNTANGGGTEPVAATHTTDQPARPIPALDYDPLDPSSDDSTSRDTSTQSPTRTVLLRDAELLAPNAPERSVDGSSTVAVRTARGAASDVARANPGDGANTATLAESAGASEADVSRVDTQREEQKVRELLAALDEFGAAPEEELTHARRLQKHKLLIRLIACHFLDSAAEESYRDALLAHLERLYHPAQLLKHLAAAFYEDLGLGIADSQRTGAPTASSKAPTTALRAKDLRISGVKLQGQYVDYSGATLRAGQPIRLEVLVQNIANLREGNGWRRRLSFAFRLYDARLVKVPSAQTEENWTEHTEAEDREIRLQLKYELPATLKPGKHRLVLEVRNGSGDEPEASAELEFSVHA
ncbi:MAG: hypothetical protein ACKVX7_19550 [Planctomycetota bacterium]